VARPSITADHGVVDNVYPVTVALASINVLSHDLCVYMCSLPDIIVIVIIHICENLYFTNVVARYNNETKLNL